MIFVLNQATVHNAPVVASHSCAVYHYATQKHKEYFNDRLQSVNQNQAPVILIHPEA